MPNWVKEAFYQRLELLRTQAEVLPEVMLLQHKLKELERAMQRKLTYNGRSLLKEWLHVQTEIASIQMGWIYATGVQDGMKMSIFLRKSEEELAMSDSSKKK